MSTLGVRERRRARLFPHGVLAGHPSRARAGYRDPSDRAGAPVARRRRVGARSRRSPHDRPTTSRSPAGSTASTRAACSRKSRSRLLFVHDYLTDAQIAPAFETFVRIAVRSAFSGTGHRRRARTTMTIGAHCGRPSFTTLDTTGNDAEVSRQARAALDSRSGRRRRLDPTAAIGDHQRGGPARRRCAVGSPARASKAAASPAERYRYLYGLPRSRIPSLVDRGLNFALTADLRSQDTASYLGRISREPRRAPARVELRQTALDRAGAEDHDFAGRRTPGRVARIVLRRPAPRRHQGASSRRTSCRPRRVRSIRRSSGSTTASRSRRRRRQRSTPGWRSVYTRTQERYPCRVLSVLCGEACSSRRPPDVRST